MLKYSIMADKVLHVNLPNNDDYSIVAFIRWNNHHETYYVSLYLKNNLVERLDIMDSFESVRFENCDSKNIRNKVVEFIEDKYKEKSFIPYISRTEYELKCFDKGNEFYEQVQYSNDKK